MQDRKKSNIAYLWSAPAILMLISLVVWPCFQLVRISFGEGGGKSGFGIGKLEVQTHMWSTQVYREMWEDSFFWELLQFTVHLGLLVTLICTILGFITAHFLWQLPKKWKPLGLVCVIVPKLSSLLVTVFGLKLILADYGPINRLLTALHFTHEPVILQNNMLGVVISKSILILPYTVLMMWAGLERIDRTLLHAASGLGANPSQRFFSITLPLSFRSNSAATLVSLIWALGAFVSPYLVGSPQELTLAVDIQRQMFENLNWPRGAAEGVVLITTILALCATYSVIHLALARMRKEPNDA